MPIDEKNIQQVAQKWRDMSVLIVGDVMLDHYIIGDVKRISPEAPVPIVYSTEERYKLGGAANVANNIKALGATPIIAGIVGDDDGGTRLRNLFKKNNISHDGIFTSATYKTTQKTRVIARNQHVLRIDFENKGTLATALQTRIKDYILHVLERVNAVILQDYNKGLLTPELIEFVINEANARNIPVGVDPKRENFFAYKHATFFKPNRHETEVNLNTSIHSEEDLLSISRKLLQELDCTYIVITLGEDGMYVANKNEYWKIPTFSKEVYDVSGAGDTVISTLLLAYAGKMDIKQSSMLANHAAGVVCGKVGTATTTVDEILQSVRRWRNP